MHDFTALIFGGALLFTCGTMLFKQMTSGQDFWPLSHCVGLILFALLGLWAYLAHPSPVTLHVLATAIYLAIAAWERGSFHGGWTDRLARPGGQKR